MSKTYFVAGIDTDVGKSVASASLCLRLRASYWKPVQSGTFPETDSDLIARLTAGGHIHCLPETYLLSEPASPHISAEKENIRIEPDKIIVPKTEGNLVIEGAGGLMVPLNPEFLYIDLIKNWNIPVILVIKTYLGCINHSLLSFEALKSRNIPLAGIIFNDGGRRESEEIIEKYADAPVIGRIPQLPELNLENLAKVADQFRF